ncbi:MAG: MarR family winged helix-turn-helix transcriptional regulator [Candidatus Methanomethylophilaceae archaeon]|jgi:DNA-binding MarR family transcriptional regulator
MTEEIDNELFPPLFKRYFETVINKKLYGTGISASFIPFLIEIGYTNGISLKDLTERVNIDKSLTTRVVKSLIEKNLAENTSSCKREYSVRLTEDGKILRTLAISAIKEFHIVLTEDLTEEETAVMRTVTEKIRKKINDYSRNERNE